MNQADIHALAWKTYNDKYKQEEKIAVVSGGLGFRWGFQEGYEFALRQVLEDSKNFYKGGLVTMNPVSPTTIENMLNELK